jgi:hypothetical protein
MRTTNDGGWRETTVGRGGVKMEIDQLRRWRPGAAYGERERDAAADGAPAHDTR